MDDALLVDRGHSPVLPRCAVQPTSRKTIDDHASLVAVDTDGFDGNQDPTLIMAQVHVSRDMHLKIFADHGRRIDDEIINLADAAFVRERERPVTKVRDRIENHVILVEIAEVNEQSCGDRGSILAFRNDTNGKRVHGWFLSKRQLRSHVLLARSSLDSSHGVGPKGCANAYLFSRSTSLPITAAAAPNG